jgi:putative ABC transport system permease protein
VAPLRRIIHAIDPEQSISDVRTLEDVVDSQTASRRAQFGVLATFAAIAVLLAAVGIYGLLSFAVSMRAREVGVRMALGAGQHDVLRMFLRQGVILGSAGVVIGAPLAYAAGRGLTSLLFGVAPGDPVIYGAAALLALLMTLAGSVRPALRAASVDPLITIQSE